MLNTFVRNSVSAAVGVVFLLVLVVGPVACGSSAKTIPSDETTPVSPTTSAEAEPLLVSASAGLKDAFAEIGQVFDQRNNARTTFNLAAAGVLQKQIEGGAPIDVFASADQQRLNNLLTSGLVDGSSVQTFAGNEIVLIVPADSTLGITGFQDLAVASVKRVATGDPEITPIGQATFEILPRLNVLDSVKPKLIYTLTVNLAVDYVARGEVDAGIVWSSEAMARGDEVNTVATADPTWYDEGAFVIGIVTASTKKPLGQAFIDFVLDPEGQSILQNHGFLAP